jgi:3-oxoacyl-[acyl-carrier protein] reductase
MHSLEGKTMHTLATKTALVTGGARGIGAATVRKLVRAGVNVAFTYQKSANQAEQLARQLQREFADANPGRPPTQIMPMQVDALNAEAVQQAVSDVKARLGRLDILVNNAGIFDARP